MLPRVVDTCSPAAAGEAAKQVSKLALQRVRELQSQIEDLRLDVASKSERISSLEQQAAEHEKAAQAATVRWCGRGWGLGRARRGGLGRAFRQYSKPVPVLLSE